MLATPEDPNPQVKESLRVEPARAREIIVKDFLPLIDYYQTILSQDAKDVASDLQLGSINSESLAKAQKGCQALKSLVTYYCQKPQEFVLRERRDTYDEERHVTLVLSPKRKDRLLPTQKEKAINELVIDLRVPFLQESQESLMRAESLGHSAELAYLLIKRKTPATRRIMLRTNSVYFDEEKRKPNVDFGAGISIDCTHEGVVGRGVYYVGRTPHWTDPWPETKIKESNCQVVANYITSDNFFVQK